VTLSLSYLWVSLGLPFHPLGPYPLFQWYPQSKDILLSLGINAETQQFNAQGSRLIIVVVQLGEVKISVAAAVKGGDAQEKGKRQDETQFTTKIDGFMSFIHC
jgi:hypothetical protein